MQKTKRILALIGVIILVGIYITTFIASLFATPFAAGLFKASVFCTIAVPVMLYAYMLIYRVLKNRNSSDMADNTKEGKK